MPCSERERFSVALLFVITSSVTGGWQNQDLQSGQISTQRELECLGQRSNINDCAERVGFRRISARLDILQAINLSTVSPAAGQIITDTIDTINDMQEEGRIWWYLFKQEILYGKVEIGISQSNFPIFPGSDFFANVILPLEVPENESGVLATTFHELLHAARAYERFKNGANPLKDIAPPQEEYEALFFQYLICKFAAAEGFSVLSHEQFIDKMGINFMRVIDFLDQKNVGPSSKIFHYLTDLSYRYMYQRTDDMREKYKDEIGQIDTLYGDYPKKDSADFNLISYLVNQGWVARTFFPDRRLNQGFNLRIRPTYSTNFGGLQDNARLPQQIGYRPPPVRTMYL